MQVTMPTAALFADVQNLYYTCRDTYGRQFNYRKLWETLSQSYQIDFAFAYAIDSQNDGQHKFQKALRHLGFEVKLKPYIQRSDGSAKGDWDVGITLDVIEYAPHVEHIFLLSGDGDFDLLLQRAKQKYGVFTHVLGVESLTANSLIRSADHFHSVSADLLM